MLNFTGVDAIEFPNSPLKLEMYAQNDGFFNGIWANLL